MKKIPLHLLALLLFVWPFLGTSIPSASVAAIAVGAALAAVVLTEYHARTLNTNMLALLAAIAAVESVLRMVFVTGVAGFTPIFLLILCAGYSFGPNYGFLCGAVSMLVSGIATGGVGAWLPYEMLAAGWVGTVAGVAGLRSKGVPGLRDVIVLIVLGLAVGWLYGALTDLWDWSTYYRAIPDLGWSPGMNPGVALTRFAHFYVVTSLSWDTFRAVGDAVMVALLGAPLLNAFDRIRRRMTFTLEFV